MKKIQLAESHRGRSMTQGRFQNFKVVEMFGNSLTLVNLSQQSSEKTIYSVGI